MGRLPEWQKFARVGKAHTNRGFNRPWARNAANAKVPKWEVIEANPQLYEPLRLQGTRKSATKNAIYAHLHGQIADWHGCPRGDPSLFTNIEFKAPFRDCVTGRVSADDQPGHFECTNCYYLNDKLSSNCSVTVLASGKPKPILTKTQRQQTLAGLRRAARKPPTRAPKLEVTNDESESEDEDSGSESEDSAEDAVSTNELANGKVITNVANGEVVVVGAGLEDSTVRRWIATLGADCFESKLVEKRDDTKMDLEKERWVKHPGAGTKRKCDPFHRCDEVVILKRLAL